MDDEHALAPASDSPPLSRIERLTNHFYAWERRGRGWHTWGRSVELEPPFAPFHFHRDPVPRVRDDARKPTFLSSLVDEVRDLLVGEERSSAELQGPFDSDPWEVEPEDPPTTGPMRELQIALPAEESVSPEAAERFLLSLSGIQAPASFELVSTAADTSVQIACSPADLPSVRRQFQGYFPAAVLTERQHFLRDRWDEAEGDPAVVVDFGLSHEFMLPLRTFTSFQVDPLIALAAALEDLQVGETGVFQVLFQPARHPWAESALRAVTGWDGTAFFLDAPEMVRLAQSKLSHPLFAALIRIGIRSPDPERAWEIARSLGGALRQFSRPGSNELIPLSDADYDPHDHEHDLLQRQTERSGMLLSSEELVSLVHPPSASVRAPKLARQREKTRAAPESAMEEVGIVLGENRHAGRTSLVRLTPEQRTQHTHVIGATGTGKSHLLLSLIIQDLEAGEGVGVLDPHGDLIDRILAYVPDERRDDVVVLDPADEERPVGFNVLRAHSTLEQTLLASDLVAVFRRLSTSWGDQMTSVLRNAVLAFLESDEGGTLGDLRRFLLERQYRTEFLETVGDPEVRYYWEKEFPLLGKRSIAPLLTRLDTLLAPKPLRYMVSQRDSRLDLGGVMAEGKIFLARLSQGAIGIENAHLLGTLLVSKFHQLALARQGIPEAERRPFWLYIDEFQHFATPSMGHVLAGARKFGLGLTVAHQTLEALRAHDAELTSAVLTNPHTRICFRVGGQDARRLEEGFASFRPEDLQNLGRGEAICRIERADWDFTLRTLPLPAVDADVARKRASEILRTSRERYGTPVGEIWAALERARQPAEPPSERPGAQPEARKEPEPTEKTTDTPEKPSEGPKTPPAPKPGVPPSKPLGQGGRQHTYLQELVKRWAGSRGWRVTIEKPILDGLGKVDVALETDEQSVACEVSVTTSPEQELGNVHKCLAAGFDTVVVVSTERKVLTKARRFVEEELEEESFNRVRFCTPEELFAFLEECEAQAAGGEKTVQGWRVKTRYHAVGEEEKSSQLRAISKVVLGAARRLRGKED